MAPDINDKIPGAPDFRWREFIRSATADARGIDNTPRAQATWGRIQYLAANVLQPLRDHFGPIHVNSGYRNPQLNKAVGGTPASFHAYGMAADIVPVTGQLFTPKDMFKYIYEKLPYTELIAEELPDGWVHVALEKGRERENQLKYKMVGSSVKRATYDEIMRVLG